MSKDTDKILSGDRSPVSQELLLRYVQGRVTKEERRRIEEQLPDDPFLADAVEGLMIQSASSQPEKDFAVIRQKIKSKTIPHLRKTFPVKRWMQLAAALVVLISLGWFVNRMFQDSTNKIFTKEFQPYPSPANVSPPPENDNALQALKEKSTSHSIPPEMQKQMQQNLPAKEPTKKLSNEERLSLEKSMANRSAVEDTSALIENAIADVASASVNEKKSILIDSVNTATAPSLTEVYLESHEEDRQLQELSTKAEESYSNQSSKDVNDDNALMNEALEFYHQNKYDEAVVRLEDILSDSPDNVEAMFYAGVSYLALKQADQALTKFKQLDNIKSDSYFEPTLWYQALAYIELQKKEEAVVILEKISSLNGEYKARAEELINTMK